MKKNAILTFLRQECDELRREVGLIESGAREVFEMLKTSRVNVTQAALKYLRDRLARFEEFIAAYEARIA